MSVTTVLLSSLAALLLILTQVQGNWNEWWTYDGISGPAYWGLINPAWTMCNKVRKRRAYGPNIHRCFSTFQERKLYWSWVYFILLLLLVFEKKNRIIPHWKKFRAASRYCQAQVQGQGQLLVNS